MAYLDAATLRPTFVPLPLPEPGWWGRFVSWMSAPVPYKRGRVNLREVEPDFVDLDQPIRDMPDEPRLAEPRGEPNRSETALAQLAEALRDPMDKVKELVRSFNHGQFRAYCTAHGQDTLEGMDRVWKWANNEEAE